MMSVINFPKEKTFPSSIGGKEILAQEEPTEQMVWDVCPYLRGCEPCKHCPQWENDEHYGKVQRSCYGLASEACRIVGHHLRHPAQLSTELIKED